MTKKLSSHALGGRCLGGGEVEVEIRLKPCPGRLGKEANVNVILPPSLPEPHSPSTTSMATSTNSAGFISPNYEKKIDFHELVQKDPDFKTLLVENDGHMDFQDPKHVL
jgi:hypothetical protein